MRSKAVAMSLAVLLAAIAACRSAGTGTGTAPSPGGGSGVQTPPPANPAPTTPPPAPAPTPSADTMSPAGASVASAAPPPAASVPDQPRTEMTSASMAARPHQDVVKLKQAGLSDEFILNKVRTENINYQLTTSDILELRAAGLTETVLEAMLRSGRPPAATAGAAVERKSEFAGLSRVSRKLFGKSTKDVGKLVVDGETITWHQAEDPEDNFSLYLKSVKEIFNTCVLRPGQNLCLEFGIVTYTGEEYRFRDPGWKNGENRLVIEATTYFRQAFPNLFFTERTESKL